MVEGARLEIVYTLTAYRGFESLSLRQSKDRNKPKSPRAALPCGFFVVLTSGSMREIRAGDLFVDRERSSINAPELFPRTPYILALGFITSFPNRNSAQQALGRGYTEN